MLKTSFFFHYFHVHSPFLKKMVKVVYSIFTLLGFLTGERKNLGVFVYLGIQVIRYSNSDAYRNLSKMIFIML